MKALRYNEGKPKMSLIDLQSLEQCVRVLEYGAEKYTVTNKDGSVTSGRDNWKEGLVLTEVLDSMLRHIAALRAGQWYDPESGLTHIGHIQCNAMFLGSKNLKNDL